jgi:hypothetical protein
LLHQFETAAFSGNGQCLADHVLLRRHEQAFDVAVTELILYINY